MERIIINPTFGRKGEVVCEIWKENYFLKLSENNTQSAVDHIYKLVMLPIIKDGNKIIYHQTHEVVLDSHGLGAAIYDGLEQKGVRIIKTLIVDESIAFPLTVFS